VHLSTKRDDGASDGPAVPDDKWVRLSAPVVLAQAAGKMEDPVPREARACPLRDNLHPPMHTFPTHLPLCTWYFCGGATPQSHILVSPLPLPLRRGSSSAIASPFPRVVRRASRSRPRVAVGPACPGAPLLPKHTHAHQCAGVGQNCCAHTCNAPAHHRGPLSTVS
jgi:hypothetical protein